MDGAVRKVEGGVRGDDATQEADALELQIGGLAEVEDDLVVVGPFDVHAHELHAGVRAGDVDENGRTGRGLDGDAVGVPQLGGGQVEDVLLGVFAGQRQGAVPVVDRPVGLQRGPTLGQVGQFGFGGTEVNRGALMNVAVRVAEHVGLLGGAVDGVAVEVLAVREVQVPADDQVVASAVGVGELGANAVSGELGVATHRNPTFNVAVVSVDVLEVERTEVAGDTQAAGGDFTRFERLNIQASAR